MLASLAASVALAASVVGVTQLFSSPSTSPLVASVEPQRRVIEPQRQGRSVVLLNRPQVVHLRGRPVTVGEGCMEYVERDGVPPKQFVLERTQVEADVTGFVSRVTVTQFFKNPSSAPVEAVYIFPLPDDAAVNEMELVAGSRVIRAQIQKREEARRLYEQAKSEGRRAALLDQERPNIFTQSVANLAPGETVKVTLQYVAPLAYDDGQYTFRFPMVVMPRFIPGTPLPGSSQGTGVAADTDRVPDASRITPPLERDGRSIQVHVKVHGAGIDGAITSGSHRMVVEKLSDGYDVRLDAADRVANRDFAMHWVPSGPAKRAALLTSGGSGGSFALMVMPPMRTADAEVTPKEMVFVIDTSCSMNGAPLDAAKNAMRQAMEQMNPDDTFMLIDFADQASSFSPGPLPNRRENVERALKYLERLPASGGTNQLDGIRAALGRKEDPKRLRVVLFMTDGFIGNETEVFDLTQRMLGNARVFSFGVGQSVNHYLLNRLADAGAGFAQTIRTDEDPGFAVERFVRRISRPVMTNVSVDWGSLQTFETLPRRIPDLFDNQPLVLVGRYREPTRSVITIKGFERGRPVEMKVDVDLAQSGGAPGLKELWARRRIEELARTQYGGESAEVIREITTLGLEYHLVTAYTSLVAVDSQKEAVGAAPAAVEGEEGGERRLTQKRFNTIQIIRGSNGVAPPPVTPAPSSRQKAAPQGGDDMFFQEFGGRGGAATKQGGKTPSVYVPPAPGAGGDIKDSLGQSDIMEVVLANKPGVAMCIADQRKKEPGVTGKLVMRWYIDKSGRVTRVEVVSEEFRSTYVAGCVGGLIKGWTFPAHATEGDPVVHTFKF